MWPNSQFPENPATFTEEILNVKLYFLYSVSITNKCIRTITHELRFSNFITGFEKLFVRRGKNEFKSFSPLFCYLCTFLFTPNISARPVFHSYRKLLIDLSWKLFVLFLCDESIGLQRGKI